MHVCCSTAGNLSLIIPAVSRCLPPIPPGCQRSSAAACQPPLGLPLILPLFLHPLIVSTRCGLFNRAACGVLLVWTVVHRRRSETH